ncbi:MAG: anaerobic ribonucleoside-triphosphate reductase activating protein [Pseudomonadota bacterium]
MNQKYKIKGILETSFIDWPGQVAAVLFLAGCNFRCPFCHNFGLVLNQDSYPTQDWVRAKKRLARFTGWIDGVVVSGGEPTLSPELPDLLREIKSLGLKVKLDTNGSRPGVLADLLNDGLLDHVAMDVKAPLDEVSYARAAGRPGFLEKVQKSLDLLADGTTPYTLRTTVVPGLHSSDDVLRLAGQLGHAPSWKIQKFNPENALDCSYRRLESWDAEAFDRLTARAMAVQAGAA